MQSVTAGISHLRRIDSLCEDGIRYSILALLYTLIVLSVERHGYRTDEVLDRGYQPVRPAGALMERCCSAELAWLFHGPVWSANQAA